MHRLSRLAARSLALMTLAVLVGCDSAPKLAPTPYVMLGDEGRQRFADVPEHFQTPEIPILYWTDRRDDRPEGATRPSYGPKRSTTSYHGVTTIAPTNSGLTWADLVEISTTPNAHKGVTLEVADIVQNGSIASVLSRLEVVDGNLNYPETSVAAFVEEFDEFNDSMEPWLKPGTDNAAIVFVHGFNNSFDDAALRLAKTWHAIGREGVPILFTWPAGFEAFKPIAYNRDRESGEFAVQSLKQLLLVLALNERIDRVHLIAHSRGTDVASTAVREIESEIAAAMGSTAFAQVAMWMGDGQLHAREFVKEPADITKIRTFTLVAADLDLDVFMQRFVARGAGRAVDRTSIYSSAKDRAILLSDVFFGSDQRLGRATAEDFSPRARELIAALDHVELIECRVKTEDSHAYLFEHPAALSDMVLSIRYDRRAGPEHGRPLTPVAPNFWVLDENYLRPGANNPANPN